MIYKTKFTALMIAGMAAFIFSCNQAQQQTETPLPPNNAVEPTPALPNKPVDKSLLIGNWVRTDAAYQIKITAVKDDGSLIAGYFNPKSINVSNAIWNNADVGLKIYVELRDENYPGSNYKLNYNSENDALIGEYFQAVEGTTYEVAFVRTK